MADLIIFVYRLLVWLLLGPLLLIVRKHLNFEGTLRQRLTLDLPEVPAENLIWLHAASVGEVKAVERLIGDLKKERPDIFILLTAMTATGRAVAAKVEGVDLVWPFPFDPCMGRFIRKIRPARIVVAETEIWPEMLLKSGGVLFVNGRMSAKAHASYMKLRPFFARLLQNSTVLAIAEADAERFHALGAGRVEVLGNLKLDGLPQADPELRDAIRAELGVGDRPVVTVGSLREGEEELVISALHRVREQIPELYVVVAPRHPEQYGLVSELARDFGPVLRSSGARSGNLLIVDTFGELFKFYGAADAAFVGGSLVELGGQNILEPVAWGIPVLHGPHMDNFSWALEGLDYMTTRVDSAEDLAATLVDIFSAPSKYAEKPRQALAALRRHDGITARYVSAIMLDLR